MMTLNPNQKPQSLWETRLCPLLCPASLVDPSQGIPQREPPQQAHYPFRLARIEFILYRTT